MRMLLVMVLGLVMGSSVCAAEDKPRASLDPRPNIVFIMADDLGIGEVGCYGQKLIQTPHIDRLAAEGMRFTDYYCGVSVCAPSRSVLMTGQHTGHTQVRGNAGKTNPAAQALRPEDITVAEVLKAAGYATGLTGKWGLGDNNPLAEAGLPERQGFEFFFGYYNQGHAHNYYPPFVYRTGRKVELPNRGTFEESGAGVATDKKVYAHDRVLEEGLKFIEAHKDRPFFYYAAWTLPHANNEAGRAVKNGSEVPSLGIYADKPGWSEQNKGHAAMISYLDTQVGRVMAKLRELGLDEKTIVFFTSDNGPHTESGNSPEFFKSSGPHRGTKRALYEGGVRVPMIVRWPGKVKAGSTTAHVAYHGDMMATLAQLAGGAPPANLDSISVVSTLLGRAGQKSHDYLYWEFYEQGGRQAVRFGNWKAIRQPWSASGPIELYDLSRDIAEATNLASAHPDLVAQAAKMMAEAHVENPNWPVPRPGAGKKKGGAKKE